MYRVKNWKAFQHYRDRNPPWIKLHFSMLSSQDWVTLDDKSRVLAIASMLIASRNDGLIPDDPAYIKRVAYLNTTPDFNPLIRCGFLEVASECKQMLADARPETENRGREQRPETDTPLSPPKGGARARQMPEGFAASESHRELAAELGVDVTSEFVAFTDYHRAKGSTFKDWDAALRTWLRNARRFGKPVPVKPKSNWADQLDDDYAQP